MSKLSELQKAFRKAYVDADEAHEANQSVAKWITDALMGVTPARAQITYTDGLAGWGVLEKLHNQLVKNGAPAKVPKAKTGAKRRG
jgi:hypothetical protein